MKSWLMGKLSDWLNKESPPEHGSVPLSDYDRLCEELHQADVLLVEGLSRVSNVIKAVTLSPWTHSALYIGRIDDIKDGALKNKIAEHYSGDLHEQLLLEAMLGEGTIITPISKYKGQHLRICRPNGLSKNDRDKVIAYAINQLGYDYDIRHLFDLYRFLIPYSLIPRRFRSSLFKHNAGETTRNVCSYMIADAFSSVDFPILPVAQHDEDGNLRLYKRNTRLCTPSDFDYSPYFDIIKYPYLGFDDVAAYRALPWNTEGMICNKDGDCFIPGEKQERRIKMPTLKSLKLRSS